MSPNTISDISYSACKYEAEFPWVEADTLNRTNARCKLCQKSFKINSMGRTALVSHATGKKHLQAEKIRQQTLPISKLLSQPTKADETINSLPLTPLSSDLKVVEKELMEGQPNSLEQALNGSVLKTSKNQGSETIMKNFLVKEQVTKAEIMMCLYSVIYHSSLRSIGDLVTLFPNIFPDSEISRKMQLQKDKVKYTIVFGLAPYFKKKLESTIDKSSHLVVGFDECLNKIAQRQQMDLSVRFWCSEKNEVVTKYCDSVFLGHTGAKDLLQGLKTTIQESNVSKIIQIGMDGPNVNFKMVEDLRVELKESSSDNPLPLNMGSCGLHTTHGALKSGMNDTNWKLLELFRALYYFFKDCPARRQDYTKITESSVFPLKFCDVRWVENGNVCERVLKMLNPLKKYVAFIEELKINKEREAAERSLKKKKREKRVEEEKEKDEMIWKKSLLKVLGNKNFMLIAAAIEDKLLGPKLAFFRFLTTQMEPFLTAFQTDCPMIPFLYNELSELFKNLSTRVIKSEILEKCSFATLDLSKKDSLINVKQIDLGFATRDALKNTGNLNDLDHLIFRKDCQSILVTILKKLKEKSPINYPFTKYVSCLDPTFIYDHPSNALRRLTSCLDVLIANKWVSSTMAENVKNEFQVLSASCRVRESLKTFKKTECRLDKFWVDLLQAHTPSSNLFYFVKIILILSHGNAALERGFSINKECIVENLHEKSLVAQRIVYDSVDNLQSFVIDKKMIHAARNAHSLYIEDLDRRAKELKEKEKINEVKKKAAKELKEITARKSKMLCDINNQTYYFNEKIRELNAILHD